MSCQTHMMDGYDKIFAETGWGLYNRFILGLTAFCLFTEGLASMSIPFILPISSCDIKMSDTVIVAINFCFSFGMAFGGLLITSAADLFGRRVMLSATLVMIFGSCLAAGFSHEYIFTSATAVCLGSGLIAHVNVAKINLIESIPGSRRAKCLIFCEMFWSIGYILFPCVCWSIMSYSHESKQKVAKIGTFRILYGVSGAFCVVVACVSSLMQESPRFLLTQRRFEGALFSMRHIYCINNSKHWNTCKIRKEDLYGLIQDYNLDIYFPQATWLEQVFTLKKRLIKAIIKLVSRQHLKMLMILTSMKVTTMFGIFLVNMWLARLLYLREEENCYVTGVDVLHIEKSESECKFTEKNILYIYYISLSACVLIGQLFLFFIIDRFDRKRIIIGSCLSCGLSSFCMAFGGDVLIPLIIMSVIFIINYSILESTLSIILLEAFPTTLRATAVAQTQVLGHLLGGFIKLFLGMPCQFTYIYMGSIMLASSTVAYFLPEFRGKPMVE